MTKQVVYATISALYITILLLTTVSAITAAIGNSRMIIRAQEGEIIERSILVRNVNEVAVNIEIVPSGDLEKEVVIEEKSFVLEPREEKKVPFTIRATKSGTTETVMNVQFIPPAGNAVGLAAKVILITESGTDNTEEDLDTSDDSTDNAQEETREASLESESTQSKIPFVIILLLSATILIIILLILVLLQARNKKQQKSVGRQRE